MEYMRVEELVDRLYAKMELLESRISVVVRGDERSAAAILDVLNQIYDLLAELRRAARARCT